MNHYNHYTMPPYTLSASERLFVRGLVADALTDRSGHMVSLAQRPARILALLVMHSMEDRTIYAVAAFLAEMEFRADVRKLLRPALDGLGEKQRYRLEYVLRMLEEAR